MLEHFYQVTISVHQETTIYWKVQRLPLKHHSFWIIIIIIIIIITIIIIIISVFTIFLYASIN